MVTPARCIPHKGRAGPSGLQETQAAKRAGALQAADATAIAGGTQRRLFRCGGVQADDLLAGHEGQLSLEQQFRVDGGVVHDHRPMQVRAGDATRGPDRSDDLPAMDCLAGADIDA